MREGSPPCPAERAGLKGWGSRMPRQRCGVQGNTQSSGLGIRGACGPPGSLRPSDLEQTPSHLQAPASSWVTGQGETSSGSDGDPG